MFGNLSGTEYWFLYTLIGNYLLAPFLSKAFQAFGEKEHYGFILLGLLFHACLWFFKIKAILFVYTLIFSGWSFYFYLGYSYDQIQSQKKYFSVVIVGVLSLIITVSLKYAGITEYVHDISPFFTLITIAMYTTLYKLASKIKKSSVVKVIQFIAQYAFLIFLCHMMVLEVLIKLLSVQVTGAMSIMYHILMTLIILIISLACSYVINICLIIPMQKICRFIFNQIDLLKASSDVGSM